MATWGIGFFPLFVCQFFPMISRKPMQLGPARITKLHIEMFHDESRKTIYFEVNKIKGHGHKS